MIDLSWCWLFGLMITHAVAYYLGHGDGQKNPEVSEAARIEIAKYEIDKRLEFSRWKEERSGLHE